MCGIMGVSLPDGATNAVKLVYDGLRQLQGRGQDGSGIFALGPNGHGYHRGLGLVPDVYPAEFVNLPAGAAIGHNRYATQGPPSAINLQPHLAICKDGTIALASNGDIPDYLGWRRRLDQDYVSLLSDNDGELLAWLIAQAYDRTGSMVEAIATVQQEVRGAYSAVLLFGSALYAFRDPLGIRPLLMAELPSGGIGFASEEAAFDIHLADRTKYREVPAGGIIEAYQGVPLYHRSGQPATAACIFELIYFARPDGHMFGRPVSLFRRRTGWRLGRRMPRIDLESAVVVSVPDSANEIAAGVADYLSRPLVPALLRAHSARRTFIEREHRIRDEGVRYKLNPDSWLIDSRDIILVDDSIVRGTTMHRIVQMIRRARARSIHLLIGSPPVRWSCFMGIATPTREELIASHTAVEDIAHYLQVDSLIYLTLDESEAAAGPLTDWELERFRAYLGPHAPNLQKELEQNQTKQFCTACFSGQYPIPVI